MALTPDKLVLLAAIMDNMRAYALKKAADMPDHWDGHEIRAWLADEFERERTEVMRDRNKRSNAFRRDCIEFNL